ncbi:MAG: flagellar biosynthetic protein FliO [Deltaproteobacteria bacterium]|nr:flagellar biosynthetic protein FliO [Deltaproteobacteria bacterium]
MPAFAGMEGSFWQQAVKVLAALSGLLGAFLLGVHFLKKFRGARLGSHSSIRVLETHYLTSRTMLHLVAVGQARFLVGSAGERLTLLTVLPPEEGAREGEWGKDSSRPPVEYEGS